MGGLLQLQQTAGNRAVASLLHDRTRGPGVTVQRAVGLEIEIPVPIDQLSAAQVTQIQQDTQQAQTAANPATKATHQLAAKNVRDSNGRVPYGPIGTPPGAAGFRVEADHDDRVMTLPWNQAPGWPLPEGGRDSIIEIVMDPPATDIAAFNTAMQSIGAYIATIRANTNNLTTRWSNALGGVSFGPLDYTAIGLPAVRKPNHNFQGSVQVNVGIDLREYHSLLKWYAGSRYSRPSREGNQAARPLYQQIRTHVSQSVDVGRNVTAQIAATLNAPARAGMGNLRGLRGWVTHVALYLLRGTIAGGLAGSAKNLAPVLLKSPPSVASTYGMTGPETAYFLANQQAIMDRIYPLVGRNGDVGQALAAVQVFQTAPGTTAADLADVQGGHVPLAGTPINAPTGVGPTRTGSAAVGGLPAVAAGNVGGGPATRGGVVAEFRTLPGYHDGPARWREVGLAFLRQAIARNLRPGT